MSNNTTDLSRRNFLKLTACATAVTGISSLFSPAYALNNEKIAKVKLDSIPTDPVEIARSSALVGYAFRYLMSVIDTIHNQDLKNKVLSIYNNTAPTFAFKFADEDLKKAVYSQLKNQNLIDESKTPYDKFLPPFDLSGAAPQPFFSAPGSGYQSHHAYPGGLVTHTAVNVMVTLSLLESYKKFYKYDAIYDEAVAGQLLHDLAKPYVFQWKKDGSSLPEYQIGGTGAHHIFSIAESIHRNLPANVIVAQACAHDHPGSENDEKSVVDYIKAAAVLCQVDPVRMKLLSSDGKHLNTPHRQAGFLVHLGDHDFVLSVPAAKESIAALKKVATDVFGMKNSELDGLRFNSLRNYIGANYSFMRYQNDLSVSSDPYSAAKQAALLCIEK